MATVGRQTKGQKGSAKAKARAERKSVLKQHGPVYEDVPVLAVAGCENHPHKNRAEALECLAMRSR